MHPIRTSPPQSITLYVPSERMRALLKTWLTTSDATLVSPRSKLHLRDGA